MDERHANGWRTSARCWAACSRDATRALPGCWPESTSPRAGLALAAILLLAGAPALPALPIAPLLFAGGIAAGGGYRRSFDELGGTVPRWVFRILAAGLFSWSAALLASAGGQALDEARSFPSGP